MTAFTSFFFSVFLFFLNPLSFLLLLMDGWYWKALSVFSCFLFVLPLYHVVFSSSLASVLSISVSFASLYCLCPSFCLLSNFLLHPTTPQITTSLVCFCPYPDVFSCAVYCSITSGISSLTTSLCIVLSLLTSSFPSIAIL